MELFDEGEMIIIENNLIPPAMNLFRVLVFFRRISYFALINIFIPRGYFLVFSLCTIKFLYFIYQIYFIILVISNLLYSFYNVLLWQYPALQNTDIIIFILLYNLLWFFITYFSFTTIISYINLKLFFTATY